MRIIDGDALHEEISKWPESVMYKDWVQSAIANAPTIVSTPNDPLTLEELREMDGKPVWVVGISEINDFKGHWDIFEWSDGKMLFCRSLEEPDIENYDQTGQLGIAGWKAYRHKPEDGRT